MTVLDRLVALFPDASKTTLRTMLSDRRVTVNGLAVTSLKEPVSATDDLQVLPRPKAAAPGAGIGRYVVFGDDDLLVINKPHHLITSTGPRDRRPTLIGMLRADFARRRPGLRVGLVHRLDADAAGLIVFSLNDVAHDSLKLQFERHEVGREYLALLDGVIDPPSGTLKSLLMERADGRVRETRNPVKGKPAVTHYQTIRAAGGLALVRARLETGRKHQIRAHFAEKKCPIVNDPIYNPRQPDGPLRLMAVALSLVHPRSGKTMTWELDAPAWAK